MYWSQEEQNIGQIYIIHAKKKISKENSITILLLNIAYFNLLGLLLQNEYNS